MGSTERSSSGGIGSAAATVLTVVAGVRAALGRTSRPGQPPEPAPVPPAATLKPAAAKAEGFQRRHAWAAFPLAVAKKYKEDRGPRLAALIAYYGFFSVFPLLLVFVAVLGFVLEGRPELQEDILDTALGEFPVIGTDIANNIGSISGSGMALAVGLVAALWAGLRAISAAHEAMSDVWDIPMRDRSSFVVRRLRALAVLAVIGTGIVLSTVMGTAVSHLSFIPDASRFGVAVVAFAVNTAMFLLSFRLLLDEKVPLRDLLPGSLVAAGGWLLLQQAGGWYLRKVVADAGDTYGVFAAVIGLLTWMYLQATLLILAAEIDVVRERRLWPRSLLKKAPPMEADQRAWHLMVAERARTDRHTAEVRVVESGPSPQAPPRASPAS